MLSNPCPQCQHCKEQQRLEQARMREWESVGDIVRNLSPAGFSRLLNTLQQRRRERK